jgi:hypothetical protein
MSIKKGGFYPWLLACLWVDDAVHCKVCHSLRIRNYRRVLCWYQKNSGQAGPRQILPAFFLQKELSFHRKRGRGLLGENELNVRKTLARMTAVTTFDCPIPEYIRCIAQVKGSFVPGYPHYAN